MRTRYRLHIVNTNTWHRARSLDHALELADLKVRDGETWRITRTVGAGDSQMVRSGVRWSDGDGRAGVVDEAEG